MRPGAQRLMSLCAHSNPPNQIGAWRAEGNNRMIAARGVRAAGDLRGPSTRQVIVWVIPEKEQTRCTILGVARDFRAGRDDRGS
jgi:hypothetical protein